MNKVSEKLFHNMLMFSAQKIRFIKYMYKCSVKDELVKRQKGSMGRMLLLLMSTSRWTIYPKKNDFLWLLTIIHCIHNNTTSKRRMVFESRVSTMNQDSKYITCYKISLDLVVLLLRVSQQIHLCDQFWVGVGKCCLAASENELNSLY